MLLNKSRLRHVWHALASLLAIAVSSCSAGSSPAVPSRADAFGALNVATLLAGQPRTFAHVVIVVQENRTPDDLFNGLGSRYGAQRIELARPDGSADSHQSDRDLRFVAHSRCVLKSYDGGKMDGFDLVHSNCSGKCPPEDERAYGYIKPSQTRPYSAMAEQYAFAHRMFQSNEGPSFPAHLYIVADLVAGSRIRPAHRRKSAHASRRHHRRMRFSRRHARGPHRPARSESLYTFPCIERPTIFDLLNERHLSWRYYQAHKGSGLWNAADAFSQVRYSSEYATDVVYPPSRFLSDVRAGKLAAVTFVTPTAANSDHAQITESTGPSWVASVVNAVGTAAIGRARRSSSRGTTGADGTITSRRRATIRIRSAFAFRSS